LARKALNTFRQLGMGYEAAKAVTNVAIAASHHGETEFALELFGKARELFTLEYNEAWAATIDLYRALVYYQDGRWQLAQALCESAYAFFATSPLFGRSVWCQILLARIHLDAGRPEAARAVCIAALEKMESTESPALAYQAYFVLGQIEETLHSPDAAYEAYQKAHQNLESLRSQLRADEMKIAFLKDKGKVFEALVRMNLTNGSPGNLKSAFGYIEQAKSRSLADLIAFRANTLPAPTATRRALVEQVKDLREQLHWYTRAIQLQEGRSVSVRDPQIEKLRRAARECEQKLIDNLTNLHAEDREFANLQAAASIDLEAIRSVLPDDAMLIQYYRIGDVFQACLLSRRVLKIVPLGPVSEMRRSLQLFRFQLSRFRFGAEYVNRFRQQLLEATNAHLQEFYRQLMAPVARNLRGEHLIINPHDLLHYVPFHALLDGRDYLDTRFSISYAPSASVYYLCSTKAANTAGGSLVLGVPNPAAPHILDEVRAVSSRLPAAEVFVGAEATHELLREKGPHSRYIHIATHGWFRQDNPMFSSISLGNSHLSLFDLYQLNLPAELVTLSGCGTGLNVVVGGDELLGLNRGLLYAGAQGVLLTLWDVNDQSTAEFMQAFYTELQANSNKAAAVRRAMAEIRREYGHPFYWAPFILVGKYL